MNSLDKKLREREAWRIAANEKGSRFIFFRFLLILSIFASYIGDFWLANLLWHDWVLLLFKIEDYSDLFRFLTSTILFMAPGIVLMWWLMPKIDNQAIKVITARQNEILNRWNNQ